MPKCLICGEHFRMLNSHITRTHKISISEYKQSFGTNVPLRDQDVIEKHKNNVVTSWNVEYWMGRHGLSEEEAIKELSDRRAKLNVLNASPRTTDYWTKYYNLTEEEATQRVSSLQSRGLEFTLAKYGDGGEIIYRDRIKARAFGNSLEGQLASGKSRDQIRVSRDNFTIHSIMSKHNVTESEAEQIRSKRLEHHVSYRRVSDVESHLHVSHSVAKSIVSNIQRRDLAFYQRKYGAENGTIAYKHMLKRGAVNPGTPSKASMIYFNETLDWLNSKNIEYHLEKTIIVMHKHFCVDMLIPAFNLIVEYDGRMFHADPQQPDYSWKSARGGLTYSQSLTRDFTKNAYLKFARYHVIRIHEHRAPNFNLLQHLKDNYATS